MCLAISSVALKCFTAAEIAIASLAVKGLLVHGRVCLVLFECYFAAEVAIAGHAGVVHEVKE
jgi:hypothetical protein